MVPIGFEELQNLAFNCGYELSVTPNMYNMTLIPRGTLECLPRIKVEVDSNLIFTDSNVSLQYCFTPTVSFPELTIEVDDSFDKIECTLCRWAEIGRLITHISEFTYRPDDYKTIEENCDNGVN